MFSNLLKFQKIKALVTLEVATFYVVPSLDPPPPALKVRQFRNTKPFQSYSKYNISFNKPSLLVLGISPVSLWLF